MPEEKPEKKPAYGVASPPGGLPGAPGPAVSPAEVSRDILGRTRQPSEYQEHKDPFGFGSTEVTRNPLPAKPQAQNPMGNTPLPEEKKGRLKPQLRE